MNNNEFESLLFKFLDEELSVKEELLFKNEMKRNSSRRVIVDKYIVVASMVTKSVIKMFVSSVLLLLRVCDQCYRRLQNKLRYCFVTSTLK